MLTPVPAHMLMAKRVNSSKLEDVFFRHIVRGMRNGVLAIARNGTLVHINDEAYRIFGLTKGPTDIGKPLADVVRVPEVVRTLTTAFDLHLLPNRAELRLR